MRCLAGAQLFALTVTHRAPVRDFYVPVSRMCVRAQCLQSGLQFFTTLYSFLTFLNAMVLIQVHE
jgi:uncharacterized membrane protein